MILRVCSKYLAELVSNVTCNLFVYAGLLRCLNFDYRTTWRFCGGSQWNTTAPPIQFSVDRIVRVGVLSHHNNFNALLWTGWRLAAVESKFKGFAGLVGFVSQNIRKSAKIRRSYVWEGWNVTLTLCLYCLRTVVVSCWKTTNSPEKYGGHTWISYKFCEGILTLQALSFL